MKIVVTGALGHIGSKFIRSIPAAYKDCEVVMLDDLSAQRYVSLYNLPDGARYRFHELDVAADPQPLLTHIAGADVVVHLAAITNAAASSDFKDKLETTNFNATKNVASACAQLGVPLFFVSTTSVYGTQEQQVDENCTRAELQPQSPYAETKLREEDFLRRMYQDDGLRFITCRFGTIFGASPGMRFHTAVNKFCWQAITATPVTVWRTALHQVRPYLDLDDAVAAIHFVIKKQQFDGEIYNVLTLNATVDEILNVVRTHISDLKVNFVDVKIMNQLSYHVLNDKFRRLGFSCQGDLQQGISATLGLLKNARFGCTGNH